MALALSMVLSFCGLAAIAESAMDSATFNERVLSIAAREFPHLQLQKTDDPLVFTVKDGSKLSLDNVFKLITHETDRGTEDDEIRRFFKSISELKENQEKSIHVSWNDVKSKLRPQIFRSSLLKQKKQAMVSRPLTFSKKLMEGFVIDSKNSFSYVTPRHLASWKVDIDAVSKCAYENLEKVSQDLKIESNDANGKDAKGKYVTISVPDGYAAARILLPEVRKRLQRDLGDHCFVAIPNRDFLIGWSPDFTHKEKFVAQVRRDFESRHHPLTPQIYEMEDNNIATVAQESAETAELPTRSRRHRKHH